MISSLRLYWPASKDDFLITTFSDNRTDSYQLTEYTTKGVPAWERKQSMKFWWYKQLALRSNCTNGYRRVHSNLHTERFMVEYFPFILCYAAFSFMTEICISEKLKKQPGIFFVSQKTILNWNLSYSQKKVEYQAYGYGIL